MPAPCPSRSSIPSVTADPGLTGPRPLPPAPAVVGVVNVTPDSFSDGGAYLDPRAAVAHGVRLLHEGAAMLDVGAESTRPGALEVDPDEEWRRLAPVLGPLRDATDAPLSVDTRHAETARRALALGVDVINDVSALRHDPSLAQVVAETGASLVLMHSRATPRDMQETPEYGDVVEEVKGELQSAAAEAVRAGCRPQCLVLDPGIGFAKTAAHNVALVRALPALVDLGHPVLVGVSRKAVIGRLLGDGDAPRPVEGRRDGSVGGALAALCHGASYVRVHDVAATCDALTVFQAFGVPMGPDALHPRPAAGPS